ncbi:tetratricopeptide repeat protein [Helicobacter sp. L8]|uniref:tetratricopeptide repeat protein n=1 Tax=Helicobacter sp. L8 TaxID=2316078 RepID=UPI000EB2CE39|nr:tetratricopeptide repeat protein [Helicobacter sp. L8]
MQHISNQLSQHLKATKRTHRLFLSLAQDMGGGGGEALQEEVSDLSAKFSQLLDTLNTFNKALEETYHQSAEDDPNLEDLLSQSKRLRVKTNTHLSALKSAQEGAQILEHANGLAKPLEDLEILLATFQEGFSSLCVTSQSTPSNQATPTLQNTPPNDNTPQVKPLWKYGANTLQAFKDYMKAKDAGSASAWLELGKMAVEGIVLYPDNNVAMRCFEKAIELGSVQAMMELGKIYVENGDIQILEYGSGEAISGQEIENALNPLKDDLESEDYLAILKTCQVFKDKNISNCEQKAKELFEKAVSLGEGRGYLGLAEMSYDDEDRAKEYCKQAIRLLKPQAQKGDGEACVLLGEIAKEVMGFDNQESVPLYKKAIDLGYADGYSYLAHFFNASMLGRATAEEREEQSNAYLKQGAKLGSGKCASGLSPSMENLSYEGRDDLEDFELAVWQSIEFMDRLMECLKLQEFVALQCRHHRVLLRLLENLSLARAINKRIGLGAIEAYQPLLELGKSKIFEITNALVRPNAWFAESVGSNRKGLDRLFDLVYGNLRAFAKPYDNSYKKVNAEGEVELNL